MTLPRAGFVHNRWKRKPTWRAESEARRVRRRADQADQVGSTATIQTTMKQGAALGKPHNQGPWLPPDHPCSRRDPAQPDHGTLTMLWVGATWLPLEGFTHIYRVLGPERRCPCCHPGLVLSCWGIPSMITNLGSCHRVSAAAPESARWSRNN